MLVQKQSVEPVGEGPTLPPFSTPPHGASWLEAWFPPIWLTSDLETSRGGGGNASSNGMW